MMKIAVVASLMMIPGPLIADTSTAEQLCTPAEVQRFNEWYPKGVQASMNALTTGDWSPFLSLWQELQRDVRPNCLSAISNLMAYQNMQRQRSPSSSQWSKPPLIQDHGGGTLSAPSLGVTCTPTGCY